MSLACAGAAIWLNSLSTSTSARLYHAGRTVISSRNQTAIQKNGANWRERNHTLRCLYQGITTDCALMPNEPSLLRPLILMTSGRLARADWDVLSNCLVHTRAQNEPVLTSPARLNVAIITPAGEDLDSTSV